MSYHRDSVPAGLGGGGLAGGSEERLVGRDRERGVLSGLLNRLPLRGAALVVRGEPGIGKSALLGEATRAAAGQGTLVLRTRGVQPEAGLPFAALHQLLRPVLSGATALPPQQRAALGAAFGTVDADAPDPFLMALATLELLSPVPVVLAVDDAQWLDRPSADVLAFTARRLETDPVILLAAIRDGYPSPLLDAGLPGLRLGGLTPRPARQLLDTTTPRLAPAARSRILTEADGNPLALIELSAALGPDPGATTAPSHPPPLTRRLEQALAARAAELSPIIKTLLIDADDPDRQAWHRAAVTSGPDPVVAAGLEEAARRARARGRIPATAAAFERAASFTPHTARRGALLLSAAEAARELGHSVLLARLLHAAAECPLTPHDQARAMYLEEAVADKPAGDPLRIRALVGTAAQAAVAGDTQLALRLLSAAAARLHWADLRGAEADDILFAAGNAGASPDDPLLLHVQACAAPLAHGPAVLDYLARTVPPADPEALYQLGSAAGAAGDYHASSTLLGTAAARLRDQGRRRALTHALTARAWAAIMTADFRTARPAAEEAARLAADTAQPLWQATAWTAQAALAAITGDQPATDRLTARTEEAMLPAGAAPLSLAQYARGLAALAHGQHADALAHLHRIYEPGDPACSHRTQHRAIADLAEAAARTGRHDQARQHLDRLRPRQDHIPWLRAAVRYADAVLADDHHADAAYTRALTRDLAPWPFTRARLRLAYGEWLRRQRRPADSRTHLRAARDTFDALGATPWTDRARRELRASGETTPSPAPDPYDHLTPQELQIARLAADGLSNRQIGQQLYLSHRTVESHLYHLYPKLGITSRAQLAEILDELAERHGPPTGSREAR